MHTELLLPQKERKGVGGGGERERERGRGSWKQQQYAFLKNCISTMKNTAEKK